MKSKEIISLNKTVISELSIEELENRLRMEELDVRTEMWTGCGCVEYRCTCFGPEYNPSPECPLYACGWKGVF